METQCTILWCATTYTGWVLYQMRKVTNSLINTTSLQESLKGEHKNVLVVFVLAPPVGLTYAVWNKVQKVLCEQQVSESQEAI